MSHYVESYLAQGLPVYFSAPYVGDGRKSDGKVPLHPNGVNGAVINMDDAKRWLKDTPNANIGLKVTEPYIIIDLDVHNGGTGPEQWDAIVGTNQLPETLEASTGGLGKHIWFRLPDHIINQVHDGKLRIVSKLDKDIDVKHNGGVLVEPSKTEYPYTWDGIENDTPDFEKDAALAPDWLIDRLVLPVEYNPSTGAQSVSDWEFKRLREATKHIIDVDDRETWLYVGMGLHASGHRDSYDVWTEWSSPSHKFDAVDQIRTWKSFSADREIRRNPESIYKMALDGGWDGSVPSESNEIIIDFEALQGKVKKAESTDGPLPHPKLLRCPAEPIQEIADYINSITETKHDQAAVHGALALFSVLAGRHYTTDRANFTAQYFVILGRTGIGKNASKAAIDKILHGTEAFRRLHGGNGFASRPAIYSSMIEKPQQVVIMDEFGKLMQLAMNHNQSHRRGAIDGLLELYSSAGGYLNHGARSTIGLTDKQKDAHKLPPIVNPSLTVLGLTTQDAFFQGITEANIHDGFLNRMLVIEMDPRLAEENLKVNRSRPNLYLINHLERIAKAKCPATKEPQIRTYTFDRESSILLDRFKIEIRRLQVEYREQTKGLEALCSRWREAAMRLALTLAVAQDPDGFEIHWAYTDWSIDYVRWYGQRFIATILETMSHSKHDELRLAYMRAFREQGPGGFTRTDLSRKAPFCYSNRRERMDVIEDLFAAGLIERQTIKTKGRSGETFVVTKDGLK